MNAEQVPKLWLRWLTTLAVLLTLTGFAFAYVFTFLFPEVQQLFFHEITAADLTSLADSQIRYHNLLLSVLGGVLMAWGTLLFFLCRQLRKRNQDWIWGAIAVSFVVWYVFDTTGSILAGSMLNVALNSTLLVAAFPPLYANRARIVRGLSASPDAGGET